MQLRRCSDLGSATPVRDLFPSRPQHVTRRMIFFCFLPLNIFVRNGISTRKHVLPWAKGERGGPESRIPRVTRRRSPGPAGHVWWSRGPSSVGPRCLVSVVSVSTGDADRSPRGQGFEMVWKFRVHLCILKHVEEHKQGWMHGYVCGQLDGLGSGRWESHSPPKVYRDRSPCTGTIVPSVQNEPKSRSIGLGFE